MHVPELDYCRGALNWALHSILPDWNVMKMILRRRSLEQHLTISIRLALFVLVGFGAVKLIGSFGQAPILFLKDQLIGAQFMHLYLSVGTLEVCAGAMGLLFLSNRANAAMILWFALSFLSYRFLSFTMGVNQFCPCLGSIASWFPFLERQQNGLALSAAIWLFLVAGWSLIGFNRFVK